MGSEAFVGNVLVHFSKALEPLEDAASSPAGLAVLLADLGFSLDSTVPAGPIQTAFGQLPAHLQQLAMDAESLAALPPDADATTVLPAIVRVATSIGVVTNDIRGLATNSTPTLPPPLDDPAFWIAFAADVGELLLYDYLEHNQPVLFGFLRFLGVATLEERAATATRSAFLRRTIRWDRLVLAGSNPLQLFQEVYGWGGTFEHQRLLQNFAALAAGLRAPVSVVKPSAQLLDAYYDPTAPVRRDVTQLRAPVYWAVVERGGVLGFVQLAVVVLPIPPAGSRTANPVGFAITPDIVGSTAAEIDITDWLRAELSGGFQSVGAIRLDIRPTGAGVSLSPTLGASIAAEARLIAAPPEPWLLFGARDSTRFELAAAHASIGARGVVPEMEAIVEVGADRAALVLDFGEGDGFLRKIFGGQPQRFELGASMTWSSRDGFRFNAQGRIEATIPVHQSILGVIDVESIFIAVGVAVTPASRVELVLAASGAIKLGPLDASLRRVGLRLQALPKPRPAAPGNLGDLDLAFAFKPPEGAGLAIDAGAVQGGGFLDFDDAKKQYAGLAHLSFGPVSLTAIGLLNTQMPDGSHGFSLFVMVAGEFPPIQLGFGFTLNGAGGLLGINRTVVLDALRDGIRNRTLNAILFPQDPIRNAPQIVSQLSTVFPPAEGRYVFGPMAKLGWGTPTILSIELGVALELPSPVRLVIMGRLRLTLPEESVALVLLKMDVLGIIDVDRGEVSVDATIYDSRIAVFAVTGDMAMRARWSTNPAFALSIGGWNPRFAAPPGFPALTRVAIALASGDNPRLRLEAYLAITSNTFQVGARFDAYAAMDLGFIGRFSFQAYLGFDALFTFDPFSFIVDIAGGVSLQRNGSDFLAIDLALTLSGPQPLHAWGQASFTFLGRHSIAIDVTVGPDPPPQQLPTADPTAELITALADRGNWSAQLPEQGSMLVSLRSFDPGTDVLAHPLGRLTVRQRVVPLNIELTRYGNARPAGDRRFSVSVTISGAAPVPAPQSVRDIFAPAQFFDLTDDEKLSRPSFEEFDAGLSFGAAGVSHGTAVARDVDYEQSVVDVVHQIVRPLAAYQIPADVASALVLSGSAAQGGGVDTGRSKYRGPDLGIRVQEAKYGVARKSDLADAGPATGSYTEAIQRERDLDAPAGTTQVVREYELR